MERENYSVLSAGWGDAVEIENKNAGILTKLNKSWVKSCNSVGNQRCMKIVNRSPFELVANLEILGVVYQTCSVPACDVDDGRASFASAKLKCGLAWYTVVVQACTESALSDSMILGPRFPLHAVYGGSDIVVTGTDVRYLTLSVVDDTKQAENSENEAGNKESLLNKAMDKVVNPLADSLNDTIDRLAGWNKHAEPVEIKSSSSFEASPNATAGYTSARRKSDWENPFADGNPLLPSRGRFARKQSSQKQPEGEDEFLNSLATA